MDNQTYYQKIQQREDILLELRKEGISLAARIIGDNLLKEDFFFCATVDRCLNLIDGFISMLKERNFTCAGALLRLEMDNCLRTYAVFIAEDRESVVDCIINGNPINKQKSKDGDRLVDGYLKREMAKLDSKFADVYNQASGYIHFSSKAFYQTVVKCEDNHIEAQVGKPLPEKRNSVLIEAAEAFIHYVELHYGLLNAVAETKHELDKLLDKEEEAKHGSIG